jgi:16S rRNA (cytosine1402-N4)-methyltransferase
VTLQKQKQDKMHPNQNKNKHHEPVLLSEVIQLLEPKVGDSYLDLTAGYGGHAAAIFDRVGSLTSSVLVDRDENAVQQLQQRFGADAVDIRWQDFLTASQELHAEGRQFDNILADLGVSSPHLNQAERGFSLQTDGPLDMRMDNRQALTAEIVVNTYDEAVLAQLLKTYGQEPKAKQIARAIVASRPLTSTKELASIAAKAWPGYSRVHPATRTFQALRIVVNDELGLLEHSLPLWLQLLAPGGRIAVISFQSLEDRIVKNAFAEAAGNRYDAELELLTKRPITAGEQELVLNPRARSAKLRAAVKIKNKERER